MELLLKGFILGFSIAAPVGPIGIFCINRTLNNGFLTGIAAGLGAATADMIYGVITGFGVSIITDFLFEWKTILQVLGGSFLLYIGIKTIIKRKKKNDNVVQPGLKTEVKDAGLLNSYVTTFILTITNPMTILFFMAVFSGLGLSAKESESFTIIFFIIGVFTGSAVWWLILCGFTYKIKHRINAGILKWINIASGILICGFALWIFSGLI